MIKTSIIGGSGYSGKELIRILLNHPKAELKSLFAKSSVGKKLSEVYPVFKNRSDLLFQEFDLEKIKNIDLVFLALPHGESMQIVPKIIESGVKIIDLGGDYRFDNIDIYEKWYGLKHTDQESNKQFIYGLPELFEEEIKKAKYIANPGCYPTSAILALAPILKEKFVLQDTIIINSLSGVSGAGRKSSIDLIYCEVNETVKAYKIGNHQHTPEIKSILEKYSKKEIDIIFTPHLIPVNRGIYSTIYVKTNGSKKLNEIIKYFNDFYLNKQFVRIVDQIPQIQNVANTNFCDIYIDLIENNNTLVMISTLDNLIKGAAGQAIQNMNLMFNYKQEEGLYVN